jgi:hypothetical protein
MATDGNRPMGGCANPLQPVESESRQVLARLDISAPEKTTRHHPALTV